MARGKQSEAWNHTAMLLCLTANANRPRRQKTPYRPERFHPFMEVPKASLKQKMQALRATFAPYDEVEEVKG